MRRGGMYLAVAAAMLTLAACGGDEPTAEEPGLSPAVAQQLAEQSEAIADTLDAGDECGAAHQADDLEDAVEEAIAAGDVPPALRDELLATARKLQRDVNCTQPQQEPPPPAPDCSALEEEKEELEAQKDEAEGEDKKEIEEQIKALEEEIKACEEGEGDGNGDEGEG